jgi:hypothetical protein
MKLPAGLPATSFSLNELFFELGRPISVVNTSDRGIDKTVRLFDVDGNGAVDAKLTDVKFARDGSFVSRDLRVWDPAGNTVVSVFESVWGKIDGVADAFVQSAPIETSAAAQRLFSTPELRAQLLGGRQQDLNGDGKWDLFVNEQWQIIDEDFDGEFFPLEPS